MPACATSNHHDPLCIHDLFGVFFNTFHRYRARFNIQSAAETIVNGARLLKNFLQHEMIVTSFLYCRQLQIQFGDVRSYFFVAKVFEN